MYRVSSFTALLRGPASSSPVCCLTAPVRGAHGGAQGDGTRHKKGTKLRIKYYDIPRIPGVTYAPDSEGNLSSEAVDEFANMSELSRGKLRTTLPGPVAVNPEFFNRNPRNLEMMNLAVRQTGWNLEADRKDYYNKWVMAFGRLIDWFDCSSAWSIDRLIDWLMRLFQCLVDWSIDWLIDWLIDWWFIIFGILRCTKRNLRIFRSI